MIMNWINDQTKIKWIVDVMARVVSVKTTAIMDGRLNHADIDKIWNDYQGDPQLLNWMLKLTEEVTFH